MVFKDFVLYYGLWDHNGKNAFWAHEIILLQYLMWPLGNSTLSHIASLFPDASSTANSLSQTAGLRHFFQPGHTFLTQHITLFLSLLKCCTGAPAVEHRKPSVTQLRLFRMMLQFGAARLSPETAAVANQSWFFTRSTKNSPHLSRPLGPEREETTERCFDQPQKKKDVPVVNDSCCWED